uniref:Uncharacterized protein n=1 Tax=Thuretia quercifolia TaxID=189650 RepID=A0A1Z1MJS5_9FLOR|nr:hypothetical protein [Thuretia quercifolia]ARW66330.1 hypothetical protein [Thuretia quercifolia]
MIKHWPNKPSVELNNSVAELFFHIRQKLKYNLYNKTTYYLYIDILSNKYKKKLFQIILKELEKLLLDIVELNLQKDQIKKLNYSILCHFIDQISYNFIEIVNQKGIKNYYSSLKYSDSKNSSYNQLIFIENSLLAENLLIYLLFGSSFIDNQIFIFNKSSTPYKHVQVLLENFIIQTSNLIIHNIFNKFFSISQITYFLKKNEICNYAYISTRSIILFINNLNWQNFLLLYIQQPKAIYNDCYQVWLISSKGIITKQIYASRVTELDTFSKTKIFFLFFLEIKDIIVPKIEKSFIIVSKYIIYLLISIFNNIIILLIRIIISYINKS